VRCCPNPRPLARAFGRRGIAGIPRHGHYLNLTVYSASGFVSSLPRCGRPADVRQCSTDARVAGATGERMNCSRRPLSPPRGHPPGDGPGMTVAAATSYTGYTIGGRGHLVFRRGTHRPRSSQPGGSSTRRRACSRVTVVSRGGVVANGVDLPRVTAGRAPPIGCWSRAGLCSPTPPP
jgi:hypothetical protein